MPVPAPPPPAAQPFTFGGVARFATASFGRLLLLGFLFALVGGMSVGRIVSSCWSPVITEAISSLPAAGAISRGHLVWPEKRGRLLAANQFLSIEVTLDPGPGEAAAADLTLELRPSEIELRSLYGSGFAPYPRFWSIDFNRTALVPWWGAWRAPAVAWVIVLSTLLLMLAWGTLALLYLWLPLILGRAAGRDLNLWRAWKLAVAAQWPGALLLSFALILYSTGQTTLVYLNVMFLVHFVPTFGYLLISPFLVPRRAEPGSAPKNPFQPEEKPSERNPFTVS